MTISSPTAFITETPTDLLDAGKVEDTVNMKRVHSEYGKLQDVIFQIGDKVSGVLAKQENEFLGAYRAHMYNVQKELQALRAELIDKENALANNEQMKSLEEECEWYRRESLRLDSLLTESKKNERFMKEKMHMLEDDRNWMANQLKLAKKQNKLLRAEIELQLREGTDANEGMFAETTTTKTSNANVIDTTSNSNFGPTTPTSNMRQSASLPQVGLSRTSSNNNKQKMSKSNFLNISKSTGGLGKKTTDTFELEKQLKYMKFQRDNEKKANNALRASIVGNQSEKRELEEFFVDCIEDVKKSILRRRKKASSNGKYTEVQEQLLQTPIELHDFMAQDRIKVVQSLLARDDVLSVLYDKIFPETMGDGGEGKGDGGFVNGGGDLQELLSFSQQTLNEGFPVPS